MGIQWKVLMALSVIGSVFFVLGMIGPIIFLALALGMGAFMPLFFVCALACELIDWHRRQVAP